MQIMVDGTPADFVEVDAPGRAATGRPSHEPPACRGRGPDAFQATALWLRRAFSELDWSRSTRRSSRAISWSLHCTHVRPAHRHHRDATAPDGRPGAGLPGHRRRFATTQTHWLRIADSAGRQGRIEHWANRDDLGHSGTQLGWTPAVARATCCGWPLATRRARRPPRR